ncbi:MAG: hypothetical protein ACI9CD_001085, partial [Candidatus Deianiraeaceae bacterium]
LDNADLDIMRQLNTMPDSVKFQFDFLNDDWKPVADGGKIPNGLWKIIQTTPQKLIIYINPPYLEVGNKKVLTGTGNNRTGKTTTDIKSQMKENGLGSASNELFMQFYYRIYNEIPQCTIGSFSKLKNCISPNFEKWREKFKAKFLGGFVCRANSFDNVKGGFPISFQIWSCETNGGFPQKLNFDVFEIIKMPKGTDRDLEKAEKVGVKTVYNFPIKGLINPWLHTNNKSVDEALCWIDKGRNDFQHNNFVALYSKLCDHACKITQTNLVQGLIYLAVRLCIPATWLNDRDQFTTPRKATKEENFALQSKDNTTQEQHYEYEGDENFINNCVVFALFEKNNTNWQIFPNSQIGINGVERDMKIYGLLLKGRGFSPEAEAVLEVVRAIYVLYHKEFNNPNASWYEVQKELKESKNIIYGDLRRDFLKAQRILAMEVASDVYKYGFLME